MSKRNRESLMMVVSALAGGVGGAMAASRLSGALGLRVGPLGIVVGAAAGAVLGVKLYQRTQAGSETFDDDLTLDMEIEGRAAEDSA